MSRCAPIVFLLLLALHLPAICQDADTDAEIARVKRELAQVRAERDRNRVEAAQDRKDFAAYQERTAARQRAMASEADSVLRQMTAFGRRRDSLGAAAASLDARKRQTELQQAAFRDRIVKACEILIARINALPPGVSRPAAGALAFLASDCKSKAVDNVEALNRLAQILQNTEDAASVIDVSEGASPVAAIPGTVSYLRVGGVFEAVVDEKGERCAVWCGADSLGAPRWRVIDDRQTAGRILRAKTMREGKTLPAFVELPFGASCTDAKGGAR